MEENLKVDKDYLEAFNLGYELAKELNLKTPMFKDFKSENGRITAINDGMIQYHLEITQEKNEKNTLGLDKNNRRKGLDLSI